MTKKIISLAILVTFLFTILVPNYLWAFKPAAGHRFLRPPSGTKNIIIKSIKRKGDRDPIGPENLTVISSLLNIPGFNEKKYANISNYLYLPLLRNNKELFSKRKRQIIKMWRSGFGIRLLDLEIKSQFDNQELLNTLKDEIDFDLAKYMYTLYPQTAAYPNDWEQNLTRLYEKEDKDNSILIEKGINELEIYKDFRKALIELYSRNGIGTYELITLKGKFILSKQKSLLLAGVDRETRQKTFIILLTDLNLAQSITLDEESGDYRPQERLIWFEQGKAEEKLNGLFDCLVKLPQENPWNDIQTVRKELVTGEQLVRLARMGMHHSEIKHLIDQGQEINEELIKELEYLDLKKEYGYLRRYIIAGIVDQARNKKESNLRLEQIRKIKEEGKINYQLVNLILGLFYDWAAWVEGITMKEKYIKIRQVMNFGLWLQRAEKRPKQIKEWPEKALNFSYQLNHKKDWLKGYDINSKETYKELAQAIVEVITTEKKSIFVGNIKVERANITVFSYQYLEKRRWGYFFYDKKNGLLVNIDDTGNPFLLLNRMPMEGEKFRDIFPILDGSRLPEDFYWEKDGLILSQMIGLGMEVPSELFKKQPAVEEMVIPKVEEEKQAEELLLEEKIIKILAGDAEFKKLPELLKQRLLQEDTIKMFVDLMVQPDEKRIMETIQLKMENGQQRLNLAKKMLGNILNQKEFEGVILGLWKIEIMNNEQRNNLSSQIEKILKNVDASKNKLLSELGLNQDKILKLGSADIQLLEYIFSYRWEWMIINALRKKSAVAEGEKSKPDREIFVVSEVGKTITSKTEKFYGAIFPIFTFASIFKQLTTVGIVLASKSDKIGFMRFFLLMGNREIYNKRLTTMETIKKVKSEETSNKSL